MKPSELKQLIKEEIIKEISISPEPTPLKLDKKVEEIRRTVAELSDVYLGMAKEFKTNPKFKAEKNDKMTSFMKVFAERIKKLKRFLKEIDKTLNEISADEGSARYENAYEKLIGRPGSEEEGRFLATFTPQERIIQILKSAYIENDPNSYFNPEDVSFMIMQMLKK